MGEADSSFCSISHSPYIAYAWLLLLFSPPRLAYSERAHALPSRVECTCRSNQTHKPRGISSKKTGTKRA